MTQDKHTALIEALERARELVRLVTIKQVLDGGDKAIIASGINEWCINEGLAEGHETISVDFIDQALSNAKGGVDPAA